MPVPMGWFRRCPSCGHGYDADNNTGACFNCKGKLDARANNSDTSRLASRPRDDRATNLC